ncbi:MAG: hypothetical protein IH606_16995 [Burkholderiales bacterium]|nr:hypothetical protein [Burkholderiales bacterium]
MDDMPVVKLVWHGTETAHAAAQAIAGGRQVKITLPANFHHALFVRVHPAQSAASMEILDVSGGAELLRTVALVAGLEALDRLAAPLERAAYRVHLADPAVLTFAPPLPPT